MPSKTNEVPALETLTRISPDVLLELIPGPISAAGVESIGQQLKKALLERR